MAFNGSGTFTRDNGTHTGSTVWAQDNAAGTKIVDTIHDLHDQDIADGLTNCLTKDGQTTPTANLPMGNYKHTGVANGSARTHYASIGQLQDQGIFWGGTSGGSGAAYTISLSPAISAYAQGQQFRFIAHAANTGTVTLAVNGLTAYQINRNSSSVALIANEVASGEIVTVVYDTTGGAHFRLLNKDVNSMYPIATTTYDIGSSALRWRTVYGAWFANEVQSLTATGSTASNALLVNVSMNNVTTVAAGTGIRFSDSYPTGVVVYVLNNGANTLKIYPLDSGGTIDGAASVSFASGVKGGFVRTAAGTWYSVSRA